MSDQSIFYKTKKHTRYAIPLLAYEEIEISLQAMEGETTEEALFNIYTNIITTICGIEKPNDGDLTYFITTANDVMKEAAEAMKEQEKPSKPIKRGFATNYYKALTKLDISSMLLHVTNFDYAQAEYLYCTADRMIALEVIKLYMDRLQHDHSIMLESAVYGFGGDMGEVSSGDVIESEIDLASGKGASNMFKAMNKK